MKTLLLLASSALAICAHSQPVTWATHIAPIIYKNCTSCHRPGEIAPTSFRSYQEVVNDLYLVRSYIDLRAMPPWKPDSSYGHFLDERRLSQHEIDLIDQWADEGHARGDSTLEPAPPVFPTGSRLGTPDLVLKMSAPYLHAGDGNDIYRCFVLPTGLTQDRNISAVEFRPGNPAIVHHALFYVDTAGNGRRLDAAAAGEGYTNFGGVGFDAVGTLGGWVPGYTPRFFPPNIAWKLPKNSDIVMQVHYAPTDSDQYDQSTLNIFFNHDPAPREVIPLSVDPGNLINGPFVIPPNVVKKFTAQWTTPAFLNLSLLGIAPHMHLLGHVMKVFAVTTGGDTLPLIWIRDWDFHWQGLYTFEHLVKIPPSTKIIVESEYDNTIANPDNPNSPPIQVTWGEGTHDEMMICYFFGLVYQTGDEQMNMATTTTPVFESRLDPSHLELLPPFADPATSEISIPFALIRDSRVNLSVYDMLGNEIARLAENKSFAAGPHATGFNVAQLPAGNYVCALSEGSSRVTKMFRVVH